jgi:aminoglycoside phosphotransferase (APT) family kinase protein
VAAREWLRRALPEILSGERWQPEIISGGLSNITYRLPLSSGNLILRRPPLANPLPRAHDMQREWRVLQALAGTPIPVPEVLTVCTNPRAIGAPFYVMREVPGQILRNAADTELLQPEQRSCIADDLAEVFAALHAVDPDRVGLGDHGRRSGYCTRQIATWARQWQLSRTRDLPDMDALIAGLADEVPRDNRSTVVHGDFRLDNVIVNLDPRPRIAAVLDWELSTLGDPMADLGLTLTYWHDVDDTERAAIPVAAGVTTWPGFPSAAQFAERYSRLSGRDLHGLPFYQALGSLKLAVILEGVHARYLSGTTVGGGYDSAGPAVPVLVARGLRQLAQARRQRLA